MAYRILCGVLGVLGVLLSLGLFGLFLRLLGPSGVMPPPLSPMGPNGAYFLAFTACGLLGWSGGLIAAARHPETSRTFGTFTAWAFVAMALFRFLGWFMGDFAQLGELPRIEALLFLAVALAFVWLRPPPLAEGRPA